MIKKIFYFLLISSLASASYFPQVSLTAGSSTIGIVNQGTGGTSAWKVDGSAATQPISAVSLPLPSTAATDAKQDTGNASLSSIDSKLTSPLSVTMAAGSTTTAYQGGSWDVNNVLGTVSLPTGAATAAAQITAQSSLTSIDTKLTSPLNVNIAAGGSLTTAYQGGTWSFALPTGAATDATLSSINTKLTAPLSITGATTMPINLSQFAGTTMVLGQGASLASIPVALANEQVQDLSMTGAAAQTIVANNILQPGASTTTPTDLTGYRSAAVQVVSTGTGGTFIFEGSNDAVNFQTIPVWSQLILTGTPITAAITASSSQLIYTFPVQARYLRLRIATQITGGNIQAFSKFSQGSWSPGIVQVAQATAANLNVTAATITTLSNGQTAHSAASTGSPLRAGGRVNTAVDTTLVQGDASDLFLSSGGQLVEKPYADGALDWQASGTVAAGSSVTLKAPSGAAIRNYVTGMQVFNSQNLPMTFAIMDNGASIWTGYSPGSSVATTIVFPTPLRGTANNGTFLIPGAANAGFYYNVQGYQAP